MSNSPAGTGTNFIPMVFVNGSNFFSGTRTGGTGGEGEADEEGERARGDCGDGTGGTAGKTAAGFSATLTVASTGDGPFQFTFWLGNWSGFCSGNSSWTLSGTSPA